MHRLSTSSRWNPLILSSLIGIINELKSIFKKSEYSYLQYHWWPIDLMVILLLNISSVKYKILIDGIAIKIRINIGVIVQINSIVWPWRRNRLINLLLIRLDKIKIINKVIKVKIIIVKSWKKIIISYVGEFEFCNVNNHVLIFNKSV